MKLLPALLLFLVIAAPARAATIYVDRLGVPHVEGSDEIDLSYGTGYALAKQRLFLTLAVRLTAQGRVAELLGEPALAADIAMRRDYYDAADVERQYQALPQDIRAALQAYSDGFNAGMQEVLADPLRRPVAFDALGYTPEPWRPQDSVAVTMLFTYVFFAGEGGVGQLRNAALLGDLRERFGKQRGLAMFNDLQFKEDPAARDVIAGGRGPRALRAERPGRAQLALVDGLQEPLEQALGREAADAQAVQRALRRIPLPKIGSYGAALSAKRTESGGGMLLGSPQAGLGAPPVFWQLGQHSPGRDCTGFTVPGLGPWTGIGWCNQHAWTLVAGNAGEQVDHYVERLDPSDPQRYRHRGELREMTTRSETFVVNRCVPPICSEPTPGRTLTLEFDETVHGPVVARDREGKVAVSVRRVQRGRWARSLLAIDGWNEAADVKAFNRATDAATGTYNLLYADAAGHALYRFTGLQPRRARGIDRRLPTPGDGRHEWRGTLKGLPRALDPRDGLLVVNQGNESKPAPWWPNSSGFQIGQASRVEANRRAIAAAGRLSADELERVNPFLLERSDGITPTFARPLRAALRRASDARLREALAIFDEWARAGYPRVDSDGDGNYDSPAIAIFGADDFNLPAKQYPRTLWTRLIERVYADELRGFDVAQDGSGSFQAPGGFLGQLSQLKTALAGGLPRHNWVDDVTTRRRETAGALIRASVRDALAAREQEFGTADMRTWLRPVPTTSYSAQGIVAPPPIRGFDHGTYSQIVDPRAGDGRYILASGNDSADGAAEIAEVQAGSDPGHFYDQRERYEAYGFFPMPRTPEQYRADPEAVWRP